MPIVSMSEILMDARIKKYAVGCYNAINLDMIRGVIEAAEQENSPVILCHAEIHFKYTPLGKIAPILVNEASSARVPVALLLDHGKSFNAMIQAIKLGFNAIMYDGSALSYDENLHKTKEIVKIAKAVGVSVEAELGRVTRPKSAGADGNEEDSVIDDLSLYTDPLMAQKFVENTGVDALAVAFGTAHGVYLRKPKLDLQRLRELSENVAVPLVMHGGSGLSSEDFKKTIEQGISKINYYTGMAIYGADRIREELTKCNDKVFYHHLMMTSIDAFREVTQETMRIFGSSGRA
jgi:fructose-bisphosphate aldolase class II